jgi:hypothetical protein
VDDDGTIAELILMDGQPAARILCSPRMIPAPGQYLLAHAEQSDAALAAVVFGAHAVPDGFICAPAIPDSWRPGTLLHMRGPLGHGFDLPSTARRLALIAFDGGVRRLLYLLDSASVQDASITLVAANPPQDLPLDVEVQPLTGLAVVCKWSDYAAMEIGRASCRERVYVQV